MHNKEGVNQSAVFDPFPSSLAHLCEAMASDLRRAGEVVWVLCESEHLVPGSDPPKAMTATDYFEHKQQTQSDQPEYYETYDLRNNLLWSLTVDQGKQLAEAGPESVAREGWRKLDGSINESKWTK